MTLVTTMELDEADVQPLDRPRPKVGRIPVTLRLLNESETPQDGWQETAAASRKGDTQFMLLLVTLFIIVNLTLITLLNHKDKTPAAKPESTAHHAVPAASAAAPAVTPPQPVVTSLPPAPPPAALVMPPRTPSAAYVTPVSPATTRTTAAPFQQVTVSDRTTTAPAVLHQDPAPAAAALPEIAPAAGTPAVSSEAAKRDLLSVINKD